ncbi:hypothetical protein HK101_006617, partial [Irineochytrium annulatum]
GFSNGLQFFPNAPPVVASGQNPPKYPGLISLEHELTAQELAVATTVLPKILAKYKPVSVAACDGDDGKRYFAEGDPFLELVKGITLPLTEADLAPFVNVTTTSTTGSTSVGSATVTQGSAGGDGSSTNAGASATTTVKNGAGASTSNGAVSMLSLLTVLMAVFAF